MNVERERVIIMDGEVENVEKEGEKGICTHDFVDAHETPIVHIYKGH